MVPFARVPDLVVQPESWFELGNPNVETVCIDLAYRWPGGDCPIFTSGDDQTRSRAPGDRHELRRAGSSSCCTRGAANTGSTRASPTWATPGPRTAGTRPDPAAARPAPAARPPRPAR